APLPAFFQSHGNSIHLRFSDAGAVYPITIDPIIQQAYLKASNAAARANSAGDNFGAAVAISGETVVVGAPYESSNAAGVNGNQGNTSLNGSGAAYVFVRNNGTWTQQAYLKASNSAFFANFGATVAISGDTIVIGSPRESSAASGINATPTPGAASDSGAAYIFVRSGNAWTQQAYMKASNSGPGDRFGASVSIAGDTVLIGAPIEASVAAGVNANQSDNSAPGAGAAYVFTRTGNTWQQQAYLKASNPGGFFVSTQGQSLGDQFGWSVSLSGDTAVVGALGEASSSTVVNIGQGDNSAVNAGAAYVFTRSAGAWTQQAYLKASNAQSNDLFGAAVSVNGDTAVIGAPGEGSNATTVNGTQSDNSLPNAGAAYVFLRNAGAWTQQAYLKSTVAGQNQFGTSVSVSGESAVIGAPQRNFGTGTAYVFGRSGAFWNLLAALEAASPTATDLFSQFVAVNGDTIVIGAPQEDSASAGINGDASNNDANNLGAAYVYVNTSTAGSSGLRFVPLTPCRLVDTRPAYAGPRTGAFGPPLLAANTARTIPIRSSTTCSVPATAKAYVLNITLDTVENQTGPVDTFTIWPSGETRPEFYNVRTSTGGYIANAAIVKAGNAGAVDVWASSSVNLIIDINGYFTDDASAPGLLLYPIAPCRAVDTRGPIYSGTLPAPYGNQRMQARENRTFRLPGSPACQIPQAAAYSMQLTLAPGELTNGNPVAYITAYPTGVTQPLISNMNALFGYAVANSAIVPASSNGSIDVYASDPTNLIIDVNGYFAPDDGTGRGLLYYPTTQCRVANTQDNTLTGPYGPPAMTPTTDRSVPIAFGRCTELPSSARAWAMNASVVPNGVGMPYLSMWPSGTGFPNVSQLNAFQGQTLANSGIVPASPNGSIDVRVAAQTHVTLEVSGYFGR
ncbi:MAG: hypothetical protein JNK87_19555, partial [Bryobacterales bacterium]|nr:hypothetical protein [Bryobacterales bacterium]